MGFAWVRMIPVFGEKAKGSVLTTSYPDILSDADSHECCGQFLRTQSRRPGFYTRSATLASLCEDAWSARRADVFRVLGRQREYRHDRD